MEMDKWKVRVIEIIMTHGLVSLDLVYTKGQLDVVNVSFTEVFCW